jgi:hypothetical protein
MRLSEGGPKLLENIAYQSELPPLVGSLPPPHVPVFSTSVRDADAHVYVYSRRTSELP